ncbi:MAG: PolC-type DNA polymerase III [Zhaonellaceae bacterium]
MGQLASTDNELGFHEFVKKLALDKKLKQLLVEGHILKVRVERKSKSWHIFLKCKDIIPYAGLRDLSKEVIDKIPSLQHVFLVPCFTPGQLTLLDFCNEYVDLLKLYIVHFLPSAKGWLNQIKWEVEHRTIFLFLPNQVLVDFLEQKKYPQFVEMLLLESLGNEYRVCLTSVVEENTVTDLFEEIEQAYIAKLPESDEKKTDYVKNKVWLGQTIPEEFVSIEKIVEEERSVIIRGEVFNLDVKELRSGRTLVTFDLTDYTNSITVKYFEHEKGEKISDKIKNHQYLHVRGSVQQDRFSQELTVMASDITLAEKETRQDKCEKKRVELHLHTKMSSLDGLTNIDSAIKRAAFWGHQAIAITDHGVVQAFPEAYEQGKKNKIKIIYGVEGYIFDLKDNSQEKEKTYHIIILVKNQQGMENLYRLISLSHLDYFYRKPRIPRQELLKYKEGLMLGSACEAGELIQAILEGKSEEELLNIASFYDYLEVQPIQNNEFMLRKGIVDSEDDLRNINKTIIRLGKSLNKLVVATCDVHFLDPEDAIYRKILLCGQGYPDEPQAPLYLRTTDEMLAEFDYLPEDVTREIVIDNTQKIADSIDEVLPIPEELYPPEIPGAEEQIVSMSMSRAKSIYGENLPKIVEDRLNKELNSIITHGFAVLYLIAHKLVKKSNDDGYLVGSRGSVGSSFVATMTGITEVNPLPPHYICPNCHHSEFILDGSYNCGADMPDKNCPQCGSKLKKDGHDIPFETFLGFEGDKVPDIDLNFSGEYQPRAHKYTEELFGKEYVYRAGTIATIAERTAFGFVKNYFEERNIKLRNAELSRLVSGCTGVKRTTGQHPGGLMVVPRHTDIYKFTPIQRPADDVKSNTITTHFDYHSISSRLVKLDILGHDDPTVIKMLEDLTGVDPKGIPLDEEKTMSIFSSVEALGITPEDINSSVGTFGIPEFGTRFVRQMLEETKPKKFSELVRISGFSHGTDVWLNNAQELIRSGTAKLSEAISTRDDIMLYLIYKGMEPKLSFKIMEDVRKGKGLKPEYEEAMIKANVPDWYIQSCKKIKYMFPKAHAVAYVTMAFRIAFYKVYYPTAFYTSFFTVRGDEFDVELISHGEKTVRDAIKEIEQKGNEASAKEKNLLTILEVALEMYCRGIKMRKIDLWQSDSTKFKIVDGEILPPFAALQGLGTTAAMNIVAARTSKKFTSVEDLRNRAKLSKTIIEGLREHGTLAELSETDQLSLF